MLPSKAWLHRTSCRRASPYGPVSYCLVRTPPPSPLELCQWHHTLLKSYERHARPEANFHKPRNQIPGRVPEGYRKLSGRLLGICACQAFVARLAFCVCSSRRLAPCRVEEVAGLSPAAWCHEAGRAQPGHLHSAAHSWVPSSVTRGPQAHSCVPSRVTRDPQAQGCLRNNTL